MVKLIPVDNSIEDYVTKLPESCTVEYWGVVSPLTKQIASKEFIFSRTPRPKGSKIIHSKEEAEYFFKEHQGKVVFKNFFDSSASGHFFEPAKIPSFPLIGEIWLERTVDFSTQWIVHRSSIEFLGVTLLINRSKGGYVGTIVGYDFPDKKALDTHKSLALPLLEEIQTLGFVGNVGFDAFIHKEGLLPIVEMNPRKTMGFIALKQYKKQPRQEPICLSIKPDGPSGLLPTTLIDQHKTVFKFKKNLFIDRV